MMITGDPRGLHRETKQWNRVADMKGFTMVSAEGSVFPYERAVG